MLHFTVSRIGGGAVEIGARDANGVLCAVITHPFTKAPWWFVHRPGVGITREKYRTRKAAMAACEMAPQPSPRHGSVARAFAP